MNHDRETSFSHRQSNLATDSASCPGHHSDRLVRRLTNSRRLAGCFRKARLDRWNAPAEQSIIQIRQRHTLGLRKIIFGRLVFSELWIVRHRHRIGFSPDVCCLREGNTSEIFCARQPVRCSLLKVSREQRASIYAVHKTTQPGWVAAGRVSPVIITGIQQVPGSLVFAAEASIESAKSFTFNLTNSFPSQSE